MNSVLLAFAAIPCALIAAAVLAAARRHESTRSPSRACAKPAWRAATFGTCCAPSAPAIWRRGDVLDVAMPAVATVTIAGAIHALV